ncbi:MAG: hypothetical protein ACRDL6_07390, partial [Solirubrobacterales bacterium]
VDDDRRAEARRARAPGPPKPPWGSFPLSELVVLVAIVLLAAGFFVSPPQGTVMIGTGLALGSLAGLELAAREHFAGYRSHTLLLAGAVGVVVAGSLFVLNVFPPGARVLAGAAAFVPAAWAFAGAFRRRSGGELYRFKA